MEVFTPATVDKLFTAPSRNPSLNVPSWGPGITDDTNKAVTQLMKDDFLANHVFHNDQGFHK